MLRIRMLGVAGLVLLLASGAAASPHETEREAVGNAAFFSRSEEVHVGQQGMPNIFFRSGPSQVAERRGSADQGKPEANNHGSLGWVDVGRVLERLKQDWADAEPTKRYEKLRERFRAEIAALTRVRYLTATERDELERLTATGDDAPTQSERRRRTELEGKSNALDQEARTLAALASPSPEQRQRLDELSKLRKSAIASVQEETERRSQLLRPREGALLGVLDREMRECIREIAERRRLIAVLDQRAGLHGGIDLTEEVLRKLGVTGK